MTPADWATFYAARGWVPVPLELGKATRVSSWPQLAVGAAQRRDVSAFLPGVNVGVLLGEASGWLVDVDLDVPEAVPFADEFLPPTLAFGKASTPRAHRLYVSPGAHHQTWKDAQGKMLAELRSGPAAHQTMMPGSTHPNGELVAFHEPFVRVETIDHELLSDLVARVAAGALLVRGWPEHGRHAAQLALMGGLLR